jgi:hypothetical protein
MALPMVAFIGPAMQPVSGVSLEGAELGSLAPVP